ncbi:hypothetical protein M8J75_012642 [Diaphorina citri]|nr:hypothetical protein M8J75_012642 [Diaphorina citri]
MGGNFTCISSDVCGEDDTVDELADVLFLLFRSRHLSTPITDWTQLLSPSKLLEAKGDTNVARIGQNW